MVIHERAEKVLALANYSLSCSLGNSSSLYIGFSGRTFHLHAVLIVLVARVRARQTGLLTIEWTH